MPYSLVDIYQHFRKPATSVVRIDDGGSRLLQNTGTVSQHYMATYPRRQSSSQLLL
jgi:hypothetical protein